MDNGCECFDDEILKYMESIEYKTGGPIIIDRRRRYGESISW